MVLATRCSSAARSKAPSEAIDARAAEAASSARTASARVPFGNLAITSPVAGLVASNVSPLSESTQ